MAQTLLFLSSDSRRLAELQEQLYLGGIRYQARLLREPTLADTEMNGADVIAVTAWPDAGDTAALVSELTARAPSKPIIVLAASFDDSSAFPALSAGARCLMTYDEARRNLARAIEAISGGGFWVPRTLLARFVESLTGEARRNRFALLQAELSREDQDLLQILSKKQSDEEIAAHLNISPEEVSSRVSGLLRTFGVRRRADLLLMALQNTPTQTANSGA